MTNSCHIRDFQPGDQPGAYHVCLKTGDNGQDGEPYYRDDPDALGRIYVGPYLLFEPELALMLADAQGVCGYALATFDSRRFYQRYQDEWRPDLCRQFPDPQGDPARWTRAQAIHHLYHHPDIFCPEPYAAYPSHAHIDLLPHAQGRGYGRKMMERIMERLHARGSPGVHLGVSIVNHAAHAFYRKLGFTELARQGTETDGCIYLGKKLP